MALNAMYLQPGALQPDAFSSAFTQALAAPQQLIKSQQMAAQTPFVAPMLQQQLRAAQMQNAMMAPNVPLAPQFSQAALQTAQMQPRLMGAQAYQALGSGNQSNAQSNLLRTQNTFYPYTLAAGADDVNKMMLYRMMYQGLNNGSLSVQNPAQAAQNSLNNTGASLGNIASQLTNGTTSSPPPQQGAPSQLPLSPMQIAHLHQMFQSGQLGQPGMPQMPGVGAPQGAQIQGGLQASSPAGMRGQTLLGAASPQGASDPYNLTGGLVGGDLYNNLFHRELTNAITNIGKNPAFGTSRGGQGGTFTDPLTGQTYSPDTSKNTTTDQTAIAAVQRVTPILTDMYQKAAPFRTLKGQSNLSFQKLSNYILGTQYNSPSDSAKLEADRLNSAEGLVKAWGVNATDQQTKTFAETVEPMFGESAQGYQNRIIAQLNELKRNAGQAQSRIKYGTNVTNAPGLNSQTVNVPSNSPVKTAPQQQPQQNAPAPIQRIRVIRPDGAAGYIPASQLNTALGAGYRRG